MPTWEELFHHKENRWQEPHEGVIRWAERIPRKNGTRILDLGCGAGRHLVFLARQGFRVYGMDVSVTGIHFAHEWLSREGLSASIVTADMTRLPYPEAFFDGLVSAYVIFHNTLAGMRQSIAEIHRVLKPGGVGFLTFQSRRSYRYGRGELLEANTYIADLGEDAGVPHHYCDLRELVCVLESFIIRNIYLAEHLVNGDPEKISSHWEVCLEKPISRSQHAVRKYG